MNSFFVGDHVEILCRDGVTFRGVLQEWTHQFVVIGGLGFPVEDVRVMLHA